MPNLVNSDDVRSGRRPTLVTAGTGVNGLNNGENCHFLLIKSFLLENYIEHVSVILSPYITNDWTLWSCYVTC